MRSSGHTLATKYRATKAMFKAARRAGEVKEGEELDPEQARQTMKHVLNVRRERERDCVIFACSIVRVYV